ncbi:30S ribosomal protein S6 [Candidatus Kuenenbacteria bacterium RIFCSPLOWO2_12_FULL_42_13]|uniref:Small ribosomal subunit protein bS6 n=1 Tax=Candidatus Kuenenbacteria bacterium RIFCSPLOWO2_12_FULL_42_13 TaxID=1798565 RepID=A0A1F6G2P0_9BACT|nr:MAG: 30S ribosomal protein S6 [Candidatus Kuenenbacteria bacterium RIFCSPLOWO2_12_FULL_42_13]
MSSLLKEYEILYFLPITFTPEEANDVKTEIASIIGKYNGKVIKEEDLGKKKLSFAIKGARHGYYLATYFSSEPNAAAKISREIKLMPQIIRHSLVIKKDYKLPHLAAPLSASAKVEEPLAKTTPTEEFQSEYPTGKVDMQELNRKIDELLLADV